MERRLRTILATLAVIALASGCGGDEEEAATPEATEGTPEVGAAPTEETPTEEAPAEEEAEPTWEERVASSQPLEITTETQEGNGHPVSADVCAIEGVELLHERNSDLLESVEVIDEHVYALDEDGAIMRFSLQSGDGCQMALDTSFGADGVLALDHDVRSLDSAQGTLFAAAGMWGTYRIRDGAVVHHCEERGQGEVVIAPDGSRGIATGTDPVNVVTFTDGGCSVEPYAPLAEDSPFDGRVDSAAFVNDLIVLGGSTSERTKIGVAYDAQGNEAFRFGNTEGAINAEDRFGWFHAMEQCGRMICVVDGNFRRLSVWSTEGEFQGAVHLSELFGLDYPWTPEIAFVGDGQGYFPAVQQRGDSGVYQGVIYRVRGLPG